MPSLVFQITNAARFISLRLASKAQDFSFRNMDIRGCAFACNYDDKPVLTYFSLHMLILTFHFVK